MANSTTPLTPPASVLGLTPPQERELARWDGSVLSIDTAPYLDRAPGPVMCSIGVRIGDADPRNAWDWHHEPMARMPQPADLLQLVAAAAESWNRRSRIVLVVKVRSLDEWEARRAWGDR